MGSGPIVAVSAFPFTSGQYKGYSLDSLKKIGPPDGITARIVDHPEWGAGSFALVQLSSGPTVGESFSPRYTSSIVDAAVTGHESEYLADESRLGQALFAASK